MKQELEREAATQEQQKQANRGSLAVAVFTVHWDKRSDFLHGRESALDAVRRKEEGGGGTEPSVDADHSDNRDEKKFIRRS